LVAGGSTTTLSGYKALVLVKLSDFASTASFGPSMLMKSERQVQLDGIPTDFFSAVGLVEQILQVDPQSLPLSSSLREQSVEKLVNFLNTYQSNPMLKELVFHLVPML
jgi:hypothetical protein